MKIKFSIRDKRVYEAIAILICLVILGIFVSMKQGFHLDEMLSFEMANAEFNPWIVSTQPEGRLAKFVHNEIVGETFVETMGNLVVTGQDVAENRGDSKLLSYQADVYPEPVWITAEQFRDYIQVRSGDAFNYLSVYFNVREDVHPPLYHMVLHTISSIFQGKAEAWMGCLINLGAIAAVMILLCRLGQLFTEGLGLETDAAKTGILCMLVYGISTGAVATALLIRMYGLLTLWCMAYFYLVVKKWMSREFDRRNFLLILVTILGFLTQYFFLFYCIFLAMTVSVLLLRRKRTRELLRFVRSMIVAAVVGVTVFPFSVLTVLFSDRGEEAFGNLAAGFSGYGTRLLAYLKIMFENTLHPLFWALLLILGLCGFLAGRARLSREKRELLWMLLLPPAGYFLLAARAAPYLIDRYVMPIFPFVCLGGGLLLIGSLSAIRKRLRGKQLRWLAPLTCGMALLFQLMGVIGYDGHYLYLGYAIQEQVAESNADYSCICIYDGVRYYENLPEFTHYEKTMLLTLDQLENRQERDSILELEKVALLLKDWSFYDQAVEILTEQYGFTVDMWGWRGAGVHGDVLVLMRKDV